MSMRVWSPLRQRAKRAGSRSWPSSRSLLRWPSGIPSGIALSDASTPAFRGTLTLAGGEGMAVTFGAMEERGFAPVRPRVACVSACSPGKVGSAGNDEAFDALGVGVAVGVAVAVGVGV